MGPAAKRRSAMRGVAWTLSLLGAAALLVWSFSTGADSWHHRDLCPYRLPNPPLEGGCSQGLSDPLHLTTYLERASDIDGWVVPLQLTAMRTIAALQRNHCISGSVGEIGVHHGRFFYLLASLARRTEAKVAIDVWEHQELNTDASGGMGKNKLEMFERHGRALGFDMDKDIKVISADSNTLTPASLGKQGIGAFRLLSIDGSHIYETVLHDLRTAACSIHDAGVFMVNDFVNNDWIGVLDAVGEFVRHHPSVAPFLWACNKLYFTHAPYHDFYLQAVRNNSCLACTMDRAGHPHPSKYTLGRWPVCVAQRNCSRPLEVVEESCF